MHCKYHQRHGHFGASRNLYRTGNRISLGLMLWGVILCGPGCTSLMQGKLGAEDLSLMPRKRLAGGESTLDQVDQSDKYYATRRDPPIEIKDFAIDKLPKTIKKIAGKGNNRQVAEEALQEGRQYYSQAVALRRETEDSEKISKAFLKAVEPLKIAADRWPDSSIEEDAIYLLGECHFFADHYDDANEYFEKLVEVYPSTRYLDRVQSYRFNIARYWLKVAEQQSLVSSPVNLTDERMPLRDIGGEARRVLDRIRLDDPTGKLSDDATFMLGQAFYDVHRYFEAAETFADLRNNYPGSEHLFNAHLMEFESRLSMYDGKHYDGQALKQASELLRTILRQFPDQSAEIRDELVQQAGQVRTMLAERDLETADYYIKRGQNAAAKIYLQRLVQDYPETEVASTAMKRLESIRDEPDNPEQQAQWLVEMFPEPQSTRPLIRSGAFK